MLAKIKEAWRIKSPPGFFFPCNPTLRDDLRRASEDAWCTGHGTDSADELIGEKSATFNLAKSAYNDLRRDHLQGAAMREPQRPARARSSATRHSPSILDQTLAAATRDVQTVTSEGKPIAPMIEGVKIKEVRTHSDARGTVVEIFDQRWGWHPAPISSLHCFTVRPGFVKGWGLHKNHEDRYMILQGEMELVLFDPRPTSSTYGHVAKIQMSEHRRCLVNIPTCVWHADHNIGTTDVVVIDMPTVPYDHEKPDKWRLPIDTPLIPYSFDGAKGW